MFLFAMVCVACMEHNFKIKSCPWHEQSPDNIQYLKQSIAIWQYVCIISLWVKPCQMEKQWRFFANPSVRAHVPDNALSEQLLRKQGQLMKLSAWFRVLAPLRPNPNSNHKFRKSKWLCNWRPAKTASLFENIPTRNHGTSQRAIYLRCAHPAFS